MIRSETYSKKETPSVREAYSLPDRLDPEMIQSIIMAKKHDYIVIIWKEFGTLFGVRDTYRKLYKDIMKLKSKIMKRPNPQNRFELWEAQNEHGVYDYDMERKIKQMRRIND